MKPRPDLLDSRSPAGLEVFQLTNDPDCHGCHIYMEAQIFTPDSQRLVLHRAGGPHGPGAKDSRHRLQLCDLADGGRLTPLTEELGATAPSVSPDGRWLYYFVNDTDHTPPRLTLKRVGLDGAERTTLTVIDSALPGTRHQPVGNVYPLSTISSDGKRLAISARLGPSDHDNPDFGLMCFDLETGDVQLVLRGPSWSNIHPQYSRSLDERASHDLLIQENHGCIITPDGEMRQLSTNPGADIHVIRDDGSDFRTLPWGRDGFELCQGHQCWRGRSDVAITSTFMEGPHIPPGENSAHLVEGRPLRYSDHVGLATPGGQRNDLTRLMRQPRCWHFATDLDGKRFITDVWPTKGGQWLYGGALGEPMRDPIELAYLLDMRTPVEKGAHCHPFAAPDGRSAFFNSTNTGRLEAYMVCNLPF